MTRRYATVCRRSGTTVLSPTTTHPVGESSSTSGRYRILRPHARGGLGEVLVARDTELHREVAVKRLLPAEADHADSRARFVLEAEITGRLEHPGYCLRLATMET